MEHFRRAGSYQGATRVDDQSSVEEDTGRGGNKGVIQEECLSSIPIATWRESWLKESTGTTSNDKFDLRGTKDWRESDEESPISSSGNGGVRRGDALGKWPGKAAMATFVGSGTTWAVSKPVSTFSSSFETWHDGDDMAVSPALCGSLDDEAPDVAVFLSPTPRCHFRLVFLPTISFALLVLQTHMQGGVLPLPREELRNVGAGQVGMGLQNWLAALIEKSK